MANEITGNNTLTLASLRGGLDDSPNAVGIADDSCTVAENVEFVDSMLGERRLGCEPIFAAWEGLSQYDAVTWMYRSLPVLPEFNGNDAWVWALVQSLTTGDNRLSVRAVGSWSGNVTATTDDIDATDGRGHRLTAQELHGKVFFSYKSDEDRLHVFHNGIFKRVGLAEPAAPVVTNTAPGGAFVTTRYYRVRFIHIDPLTGGITAKSEPSETTTFVPSGANSGAVITEPASIDGHETDWEIEASLNNVDFYKIGSQSVALTTFTDLDADGSEYDDFELSENIGEYSLIGSCKFLSADEDRLIMASSWEDDALTSRVSWTPVYADPGDANDERIDLSTDPFVDLDAQEGGQITAMSRVVNGYIYVFKQEHIYKLIRTNTRSKAYEAVCVTKSRGALVGSLVEAIDQEGNPTLYFLDPSVGPMRLGANGLQWCGRDVQTTWARINKDAIVPCHGIYYANKKQLHYWLAVDGADYPNFKIILHVNEMRNTEEGGRRGWVTVGKDNRIATAHCSVMAAENLDTSDDQSLNLVPYIGKEAWTVNGSTIRDYIQKCDVGDTDAHSTGDTASIYYGVVTSKPFILGGLLNQYGILAGALLAKASDEPDGEVFVKATRDFGRETKVVSTPFYTSGGESHVVAQLDDLTFSELHALQISLGDLDENVTPPASWGLDMLQLKLSGGNKA